VSLQFCPQLVLATRQPNTASPIASDLLSPFIVVLRISWKKEAFAEHAYQTVVIAGKDEPAYPARSCAAVSFVTNA
jgi:hypothetical protein